MEEVQVVLAQLTGVHWLMACLLYGAGLRLMECVRLRVKDVDFDYDQITVCDGKGEQDRVTVLPQTVEELLQRHLARVKLLHEDELAEGYGDVYLPYALARKYPRAGTSWEWQYVFPASKRSVDPRSGLERAIIFQRPCCSEPSRRPLRIRNLNDIIALSPRQGNDEIAR